MYPKHGANPQAVYEKLKIPLPAKVLDYSENVNDLGPPSAVLRKWPELLSLVNHYPDPTGEPFLTSAAAYHQVPKSTLIIGNGASELLMLLAERYRGKRAIIVHPTFSEYESTLLAKGVEIIHLFAEASNGFHLPIDEMIASMQKADVLYLCTPNNPTGIMPSRQDLLTIIEYGAQFECEVVLDEAFIDFVDESLSFIPKVRLHPHLIIIRSMTKMYAIAGIRLGYLIANASIITELKMLLPHWNVNGIASHIGAICLEQQTFREESIRAITLEREKTILFLENYGCNVTKSVANYLSFSLANQFDLNKFYLDLLELGIVLRHTENFRGMDGKWFRMGIKSSEMMEHLKKELSKWFEEN